MKKFLTIVFTLLIGITSSYAFGLQTSLGLYSRGEDVSNLQNFLKSSVCPDLLVSGFFGVNTQSCVRLYQKDNNIPTTGFVGLMTRESINKAGTNQVVRDDIIKSANSRKLSDFYDINSRVRFGSTVVSSVSDSFFILRHKDNTSNAANYLSTVTVNKKSSQSSSDYDIKGLSFKFNGQDIIATSQDFASNRDTVFCVNKNNAITKHNNFCPSVEDNQTFMSVSNNKIELGFFRVFNSSSNLSYDAWCKSSSNIPVTFTFSNGDVYNDTIYVNGTCQRVNPPVINPPTNTNPGASGQSNSNISFGGAVSYPKGVSCSDYGYSPCARWVSTGEWGQSKQVTSDIGVAMIKIGTSIAVATGQFANGASLGGDCSGGENAARNTGNSASTGYIGTYAMSSSGQVLSCEAEIITSGTVQYPVIRYGVPNIDIYADYFALGTFMACNGGKVATTDANGNFSFRDKDWCPDASFIRKSLGRGPVLFVDGALDRSNAPNNPNYNKELKPGFGVLYQTKALGGPGHDIIWK